MVHSVSLWLNLKHLAETLGVALVSLLEAVVLSRPQKMCAEVELRMLR